MPTRAALFLTALLLALSVSAEEPLTITPQPETLTGAPAQELPPPTPPNSASSPALPPPTLGSADLVVPFGDTPTLTTTPLRISAIALQEGEQILNIGSGDSSRWLVTPGEIGSGAGRTVVLLVKPTADDLRTNLTIGTDRRLYTIDLVSSSRLAPVRLLRFTYPADDVRHFERVETAGPDPVIAPFNPADLHFRYVVQGRAPWSVERAFDDGHRTYIQLSPSAPAPALIVLDNGETLPNTRNDGAFLVVDGLFRKAKLVARSGRTEQVLTLTRVQ